MKNECVENSIANGGEGMENEQGNGNDAVTQTILKVMDRVTNAQGGSRNRATIVERVQSNGAKKFKGEPSTTPTTIEY